MDIYMEFSAWDLKFRIPPERPAWGSPLEPNLKDCKILFVHTINNQKDKKNEFN